MENQDSNAQQPSPAKDGGSPKLLAVLLLIAVVIVVGGVALYLNRSDKKDQSSTTDVNPIAVTEETNSSLTLSPGTETVKEGATFSVTVWVDTAGQSVNAVTSVLEYPTDLLDFQSVDNEGSAFEIVANTNAANGEITIERGQLGGVVGRHKLATVNFVAKVPTGEAKVTFNQEKSAIIKTPEAESLTASNILGKVEGATYTLGVKE